MARTFIQHTVRKSISLPEMWNFHAEGTDIHTIPVPCCIETNPRLISYKGDVEYETSFHAGGNIRLEFSGVSHTGEVYLDDNLLGSHYGAYGAFDYVIPDLEEGEHKLFVKVNNTFNDQASINRPNDYYTYGGITRPVVLERLGDVYIKQLHFIPYQKADGWHGRTEIELVNLSPEVKRITLQLTLKNIKNKSNSTNQNNYLHTENVEISGNENRTLCIDRHYPQADSYMPAHPALYFLKALLMINEQEVDDCIDRVGFREVKVSGEDILLNGEKILIKGFNRHEDFSQFGCAVPLTAMYLDMELIKSTGANLVRTSHYPNDDRWLDLCDENGILVWEEGHARGINEKNMKHPLFIEQEELTLREMIDQHYNHPSIIMWGLLNESSDFTDFGKKVYKTLIDLIRSKDKSRPVTYASCHYGEEVCFDLVDIVSVNMYPGWYDVRNAKEFLEYAIDWSWKNGGSKKPMIISEIGAGAIYGNRDSRKAKWSEERQEILLEEQLRAVYTNKYLSGAIIWQFSDCRVDEEWFASRPKTENNKGVVDKYRREKLSYRKVSEIYNDIQTIADGSPK